MQFRDSLHCFHFDHDSTGDDHICAVSAVDPYLLVNDGQNLLAGERDIAMAQLIADALLVN